MDKTKKSYIYIKKAAKKKTHELTCQTYYTCHDIGIT